MGSLAFEQFITAFLFPALTIYYNELRMCTREIHSISGAVFNTV